MQFVAELIMQCFRDKRKVSAAEGQGKVDELEKWAVSSSSGAAVAAVPEILFI